MAPSRAALGRMAAAAARIDPHAAEVLWDRVAKAEGPPPWESGVMPPMRRTPTRRRRARTRSQPSGPDPTAQSQQARHTGEDSSPIASGFVTVVAQAQRRARRPGMTPTRKVFKEAQQRAQGPGRTAAHKTRTRQSAPGFVDVVRDLRMRGRA